MSESMDRIVLEESWKSALQSEFDSSYMRKLREFLVGESQSGKIIYPKGSQIFHALDLCPLHKLKSRDYWTRPVSWTRSSTRIIF